MRRMSICEQRIFPFCHTISIARALFLTSTTNITFITQFFLKISHKFILNRTIVEKIIKVNMFEGLTEIPKIQVILSFNLEDVRTIAIDIFKQMFID